MKWFCKIKICLLVHIKAAFKSCALREMTLPSMKNILENCFPECLLSNLETLRGFIIWACNLINIRYADDIALMAKSERKLQELLHRELE